MSFYKDFDFLNYSSYEKTGEIYRCEVFKKDSFLADVENAKKEEWSSYSLNQRAAEKYTTSYFEKCESLEILNRILQKFLKDEKKHVLELGAGDGRFLESYSNYKNARFILNDLNFKNLQLMSAMISKEMHERTIIIEDDCFSLGINEESVDIIVAWGIFSLTTKSISECLRFAYDKLKRGGILIFAEPNLEAHLVYSLVRGDLNEFSHALMNKTRAADFSDKSIRYSLSTIKEYESWVQDSSFNVLEAGGISLFPSLVFGGVCQEKEIKTETKRSLEEILLEKVIGRNLLSLYRQTYWVLSK